MRKKNNISNKLLDMILIQAAKVEYLCIDEYLKEMGYDMKVSRAIRDKLINDGMANPVHDGGITIEISIEGRLFENDGGYRRKALKEYIPHITALIGCISGVISFIWHVLTLIFG